MKNTNQVSCIKNYQDHLVNDMITKNLDFFFGNLGKPTTTRQRKNSRQIKLNEGKKNASIQIFTHYSIIAEYRVLKLALDNIKYYRKKIVASFSVDQNVIKRLLLQSFRRIKMYAAKQKCNNVVNKRCKQHALSRIRSVFSQVSKRYYSQVIQHMKWKCHLITSFQSILQAFFINLEKSKLKTNLWLSFEKIKAAKKPKTINKATVLKSILADKVRQNYSHGFHKLIISSAYHTGLQVQKIKLSKVDENNKVGLKKNDLAATLKKKLVTYKGQIEQSKIQLRNKKNDLKKQITIFIVRKNEQFRRMEIQYVQVVSELGFLEKSNKRKMQMMENRRNHYLDEAEYVKLYREISSMKIIRKSDIINKIPKEKLKQSQNSIEFLIIQNLKLRGLQRLYEKVESQVKKSQLCSNAEQQNFHLRQMIKVLIKFGLEEQSNSLEASAEVIDLNLQEYLKCQKKVNLSKSRSRVNQNLV